MESDRGGRGLCNHRRQEGHGGGWTLQTAAAHFKVLAADLAPVPRAVRFRFQRHSVDSHLEMSNVNWKPFVFGGLASVTAECGE